MKKRRIVGKNRIRCFLMVMGMLCLSTGCGYALQEKVPVEMPADPPVASETPQPAEPPVVSEAPTAVPTPKPIETPQPTVTPTTEPTEPPQPTAPQEPTPTPVVSAQTQVVYHDMVCSPIDATEYVWISENQISKPSIEISFIVWSVDVGGAVDVTIDFENASEQNIRSVEFQVQYFDAYGYPEYCSESSVCRSSLTYDNAMKPGKEEMATWNGVVYSSGIAAIAPISALIAFENGETQRLTFTGTYWNNEMLRVEELSF